MDPPEGPPDRWLSPPDGLALLRRADLEVAGRLVMASNTTLYCRLLDADQPAAEPAPRAAAEPDDLAGPGCVYKPVAGERPLWDFPEGTLAAREVAAFEVSECTGWGLVPPTILRDGPLGVGMCQLWVDHDEETQLVDVVRRGRPAPGWLHVLDAEGGAGDEVMLVHADDPDLRRTAVFDCIVNNADRKAGHLLTTVAGLRVVDHGVTFHVDPKLRTVLWGWAGSPLADDEIEVLERLCSELRDGLGARLRELLAPDEVDRTGRRVERLLRTGVLPRPAQGWRGLPWPPF